MVFPQNNSSIHPELSLIHPELSRIHPELSLIHPELSPIHPSTLSLSKGRRVDWTGHRRQTFYTAHKTHFINRTQVILLNNYSIISHKFFIKPSHQDATFIKKNTVPLKGIRSLGAVWFCPLHFRRHRKS